MKPRFFATPAAFRAWLAKHHASAKELVVGFHKRHTGKPSLTWPQSVDEALCFGWIDGVRRRLHDGAYSIRFTPRKPTSTWSAINVARVAELERAGRMTDAGRRAFAARSAEKTGIYSYERATAKLAPHEARVLAANRAAASYFAAQPPWYRRACTHWIASAKRDETRARRLAQLIADSAAGRWIKLLRRPGSDRATRAPRRRRAA
jgi:uncharacterized protein YdeI (YjbR/CyaY-like superfamily)